MDNEQWIKEQEANHMFRNAGNSSDAIKMLEKSLTNRDIHAEQGKYLLIARTFDNAIDGLDLYGELCDGVENTQMNVDNQARKDFSKIAIEQFQGKLAHMRRSAMESLI